MVRYVEYIVWNVRLWLVDFGQRVRDREAQLTLSTAWDHDTVFARFVDRVAPWQHGIGYQRRSLRRLLYGVRHPIEKQRFWSLSLVQSIVYRLVPRTSPGRYETYNPRLALIAEWLDTNSEMADVTTGDSDWYQWAALFAQADVPWSLKPETWLLTVDTRGFVTASDDEAEDRFDAIDREYVYDPENEDEFGGPDDSRNVEGDPTLNGAFGGVQVAQ